MIKYLKIIFSISLFFQIYYVAAQVSSNVVYGNSRNELIYINSDTIFLKLCNNSPFNTFLLGKGLLAPKNGSFSLNEILPMMNLSTSVNRIRRKDDSIRIIVLYYDDQPVVYANIKIKDCISGKLYTEGNCDKNGIFALGHSLVHEIEKNKSVSIFLAFVGFVTEQQLKLELGTDYIIKPVINYPFNIMTKKRELEFKILDNKKMVLNYDGSETVLELLEKGIEQYDFFQFSNMQFHKQK